MRPRLLALSLALCASAAQADEGMWMPSQLPQIAPQLRAAGFKGDPAALAELARAPMNAVVKVGGATGSFVSGDGLVLTNHHVAFGVIQYNAKPERNLIRDGFVAADRAAELPANPDFRVLVTTGFDRVTDRILGQARGKRGRAYYDAVDAATKALVAECEREPGQRCSVANMYYGTDFYLIRQLELRDIRLVYAPPDSIGNYGDEVDNFVWPRHSGDFTLLRAYVGRDGKPADYAADNVPYQPPGHLQIATEPVREGDYAMLAGYPGVTFRHRMASEFAQQVQWQLPSRVALYGQMIRTIEAAAGDAEAKVRYAAQVAGFKNTLKRAQGELDGLRRSDAVRVRVEDEKAMLAWLQRQPDAGAARADIEAAQRVLDAGAATRERDQLLTAIRTQPQLLNAALTVQRLAAERAKPDAERESGFQQRDQVLIAGRLKQVQRRYAPQVEKALLLELLLQYKALPKDQRVAEFEQVFPGEDRAGLQAVLDALYAGTGLGEEAARLQAMQADAAALAASQDRLLRAAAALLPAVLRIEAEGKAREGELLRLRPAYMRALIDYRRSQGRAVYPDANSTLRVSFGAVSAMDPRDGVRYRPLTTVEGIAEKHTGQAPFDAPLALRDAIARRDFGSTADPELKTQTVDLLTNLDTTGGNSGSPVLDAHGRLIGLNFDSNWEAVSASWMFDPRYKRAIHVDMRYLRWLMAKVYPAPHLLKEMNLPEQ